MRRIIKYLRFFSLVNCSNHSIEATHQAPNLANWSATLLKNFIFLIGPQVPPFLLFCHCPGPLFFDLFVLCRNLFSRSILPCTLNPTSLFPYLSTISIFVTFSPLSRQSIKFTVLPQLCTIWHKLTCSQSLDMPLFVHLHCWKDYLCILK